MRTQAVVCGWLIFTALPVLAADARSKLFKPETRRVLILSGFNNHDWRTTTPFLREQLERTRAFDVRVEEEPHGITASTLAVYDTVVLDYNGTRLGQETEMALADFVRSGHGLVVVHGASWAFNGLVVLGDHHVRTGIMEPPWPEYRKMIGGVWSEEEPKTGHGLRHEFTVKIVNRSHPVTRGLPAELKADDELYHQMRMQPGASILAMALDESQFKGIGKEEPIFWTVSYGAGRVFHTILGHDVRAMQADAFLKPFLGGAAWAAGYADDLISEIEDTPR
jgi:type 1 glutamine amidotransferase